MYTGLRLENFTCRAVENVDLEVELGQCMGLTGPSGTGKTLFLRALADLDVYQGKMTLDGRNAADMPAPQWRRQVGLLPAESAWWFDTVGEHFDRLPDGWLERTGFQDQVLGWPVAQLSSGERQRLSLLRLLAQQPKILLLDEPTANLDKTNTLRVERLIEDYQRSNQPGIVWISHDIEQLKRCCNHIRVLEQRKLKILDSCSDFGCLPDMENLS